MKKQQPPAGMPRDFVFTPTMIKVLKANYAVAVAGKKESFELVKGREILTGYARYLVEYLDSLETK